MIKIIKLGTKRQITCDECGCYFSYEKEDICCICPQKHNEDNKAPSYFIKCPQCGETIIVEKYERN